MAFQGHNIGDKIRVGFDTVTNEYGTQHYIQLGGTTVKGNILSASTSADNKYVLSPSGFDAVLVAYSSGSADDYIWAWKIGASKCQMILADGQAATRAYVALGSDTDGRIYTVAVPDSNPVVAEHFREVGHCVESKTSGTDILVMVETHAN